MHSTTWFNYCAVGYFIALFILIANLAGRKESWRKLAVISVALSFIAQTVGMVFRWGEAGRVEVAATERATGLVLEGWTHFVVFTQHPPWSNLYEIMVFMSWGVVLVYMVSEVKWKIPAAGIFALLLSLLSLGLASLTTDTDIKPLVPALQSWWIHVHVISASVAYSAGTIGAVTSLIYLVAAKNKLTLRALGAGTLVVSALLTFILGRGIQLFTTGQYRVKLLKEMGGEMVPVGRMVQDKFASYYLASPNVGLLLAITLVASIIGAIYLWKTRAVSDVPNGTGRLAWYGPFVLLTATIGVMLYNNLTLTAVEVAPEVAGQLMPPGPWRLAMQSNQWDLSLFAVVWGAQLFVTLCILFPERARSILPTAEKMDRVSYYTIMIAFALVAVVLVTGALWAHYAWGRYWAWDPKETGALVIWINYAIYLHTRMTYGWVGVPSAVIGILGFFIIIAGFLGVNLGWFAEGLHSYGSA